MNHLKLVFFWALGAIFLLLGVWILGNLELKIGVSNLSYYLTLLLAFVLFLLAGLCWIAVAVATKHE